jgi:hypothetical protein
MVAGPGKQGNPPSIAADENGNFIVAWTDNRNQNWPYDPWEIFAQRFNSDGELIGSVFKISNNTNSPYEYPPHITLYNNRIYSAWPERDRLDRGTGIDIWANVLDWDNPVGFKDHISGQLPSEIKLYQNYPNPFNPTTMINYELPITNYVELSVFNILGAKIMTLVAEKKESGFYQVEWDASTYASGVYYYRLSTNSGLVQTKKCILLK